MREYLAAEKQNMGLKKSSSKESFQISPRSGKEFTAQSGSPMAQQITGAFPPQDEATHSQEDARTDQYSQEGHSQPVELDERAKLTLHPDVLNAVTTELSEKTSQDIMKNRLKRAKRKLSAVAAFEVAKKKKKQQVETSVPLTFEEEQQLKRAGIELGAKVDHEATYAVIRDEHGFERARPKAGFDQDAFASLQPPYQYSPETVGNIGPFVKRDSRAALHEKEMEYSDARQQELALRPQHTTMLSSEKKKQVDKIAKQKFMLHFGSNGGLGNTLQPEPSRVMLANRSFLEPQSTKHDTSQSKGHIKNLAQEFQQKKVNLDLNIKSSKAFEIKQHHALWQIIAALETTASAKQKADLEQTEPVKRGDDEDRQRFLEQQQLVKDTSVRDMVSLGAKGSFKATRFRRGGSVSVAADDDDEEPAVRKYREMMAKKHQRARSTVRPGLGASPSTRALNTDDKRFQRLITLENKHNAKSRQSTLPQIGSHRSSVAGSGPIGSYAHLQEQWKEINNKLIEKRRFVRDFARQQLAALDADDVRRTDERFQERMAVGKGQKVAVDAGDFFGTLKLQMKVATTTDKARKAPVFMHQVPSQILSGIEENKHLLEELQREKGRTQQALDAAKTKEQEMRDSGLVYPKRVTDRDNMISKHEQLQKLFEYPQASSKKAIGQDLLVAKELMSNSRSRSREGSKEGTASKSPMKEDNERGASTSTAPKFSSNMMTHEKLINIKDQLFDLILAHVKHQKAYPGKAINILPGDFVLSSYQPGDVQKVTKADIYRLFGMQEPADGDQDSIQSQRHNKIRQLTLAQLSSRQFQPPKAELPGKPKSYSSPKKARNYIQEALEELPHRDLVKLVEILYSTSKGENKVGGTFQLQHFGSFISGIGQGAEIDSQLSQGKFASPSQSQSSLISEIQNVVPNTIGVKAKINTFKSKVQVKKKEGMERKGSSGYLDRINEIARNATLNLTDSQLVHEGFEMRNLAQVPSLQQVGQDNVIVYPDTGFMMQHEQIPEENSGGPSEPISPNQRSPFQAKKKVINMAPTEKVFLDNNPDYKIGSSEQSAVIEQTVPKRKGQQTILGIFEEFASKDDFGKYKRLLEERHKLDSTTSVFVETEQEEKITAPQILKEFNEQILKWRYRLVPTFSGDLGMNVLENSGNVPEILLPNKRSSHVTTGKTSGAISPTQSQSADSQSIDMDYVEARINHQETAIHIDVTPTKITSVASNLRTGQMSPVESRQSSPLLNRDESVLRIRANQPTPSALSQGTQDYYQNVIDTYKANRDMQHEFNKLIKHNQTNLDLSALGAKRNKMFVQINLTKMAKQYQSGAYYLLQVANHCVNVLRQKHNSIFQNKKKTDGGKQASKMQHQQIVFNESPFARVEQQRQVEQDAVNIVPIICSHITFSTGSKPSTRKFAAGALARGRFYMYGGQSVNLLCDMKSYSFAQNSWSIESQRGLGEPLSPSKSQSEINSSLSRQVRPFQQHPLAVIPERCQHTMCSFQNRYMVVFGGAGDLIPMLNRRETFNDLYVWDTHQNYKEGNARWVDMNDNDLQRNTLKADIMRAARLDPQAPIGVNPDLQEIQPPLRRAQHAAGVYGGCLLIHGGLYGEDNRVLGDFAMFDIALGRWIKCKQPKRLRGNDGLGPRCMHTMTVVQEPNVSFRKRNSRIMWLYDPASLIQLEHEEQQGEESVAIAKRPMLKYSGIFVFGGLKGQFQESAPGQLVATQLKREPQNDLYLITPCYQRNQKYLTREAANFKKAVKTQICYQVTKLQPTGRPPVPRYSHGACFVRKYFVVHGGRNDDLFQTSMKNIGLNDIHLYDTERNMWMGLAIFDSIPPSRWGHQLVAEQTYDEDYQGSRIYVFGGVNLLQYSDSTIYCFDIDESKVVEFLEEGEQAIDELERMGSYKIKSSFSGQQ